MVLLLQPGRLKAPVSYVCLLWHFKIISFKHAWKQRGNVPCQLSLVLICYIVMVQWLWLRTIQLQSLSGGSQYHKVKACSSIWAFVRNISSRWVFFKLWPTVNHHEWTMNFKEFPIIVIAAVLSLSLCRFWTDLLKVTNHVCDFPSVGLSQSTLKAAACLHLKACIQFLESERDATFRCMKGRGVIGNVLASHIRAPKCHREVQWQTVTTQSEAELVWTRSSESCAFSHRITERAAQNI